MYVKSILEMPRINYLFIILLSLFLATFATTYVYSSSENIDSHHYVPDENRHNRDQFSCEYFKWSEFTNFT